MSCYWALWLFVLTAVVCPCLLRLETLVFPTDIGVSSTGVSNVPGVFDLVGAPAIAGVHALVGSLLHSAVAKQNATACAAYACYRMRSVR